MAEGEILTLAKIKSYELALGDLAVEQLEEGLRRCTKECKFFPSAAEIREKSRNIPLEAEAAWETVQKLVYRDWHPDVGWSRPVQLEPAMEYAIRQCGGMLRIHDCPQDTFSFLRKDFLSAYARYQSEGGEQIKLSHTQAKELLGKLQKELPQ